MKRLPMICMFLALVCALLTLVDPAGASPLDPAEVEMGLVREPSPAPVMLPVGKPGNWFDYPALSCSAQPGGPQYQTPPDECQVCGPWPGTGSMGPHNCTDGERRDAYRSCSCPVSGGATIGGRQQIEEVCYTGAWHASHYYPCIVAGPPYSCNP